MQSGLCSGSTQSWAPGRTPTASLHNSESPDHTELLVLGLSVWAERILQDAGIMLLGPLSDVSRLPAMMVSSEARHEC